MKGLFLFFFLANIVVLAMGYFMLPERVATHFGGGGVPNGWSRQKLGSLMAEFGAAFFAFFLVIGLLVHDANRSDPVVLNERLFLGALVIFFAFTLFWVIRIFRAFRVPAR